MDLIIINLYLPSSYLGSHTHSTMANRYPNNELGLITCNILGFSRVQCNAISDNGWVNLEDLEGFKSADITTWARSHARVPE